MSKTVIVLLTVLVVAMLAGRLAKFGLTFVDGSKPENLNKTVWGNRLSQLV